jgi:hypothetical protein
VVLIALAVMAGVILFGAEDIYLGKTILMW